MSHDNLRALALSATPGPWTNDAQLQRTSVRAGGIYLAECDVDSIAVDKMLANAAFIAAASPDVVIGLLDEVEALREANKIFARAAGAAANKQREALKTMTAARDEACDLAARCNKSPGYSDTMTDLIASLLLVGHAAGKGGGG